MPPEDFPFHPHPSPPLKPVLLWDGDCGFCSWSARRFDALSRRRVLTAPVQPLLDLLPAPVRATASQQVLLLEPDGRITGGVRALSLALRLAGRPTLGALLGFPALYPLFRLAYRAVARLRRFFPAPRICPL